MTKMRTLMIAVAAAILAVPAVHAGLKTELGGSTKVQDTAPNPDYSRFKSLGTKGFACFTTVNPISITTLSYQATEKLSDGTDGRVDVQLYLLTNVTGAPDGLSFMVKSSGNLTPGENLRKYCMKSYSSATIKTGRQWANP